MQKLQNANKKLLFFIVFLSFVLNIPFSFAEAKEKPVYMIIDILVTDKDLYSQYTKCVTAIVEKYGGRYLTRGGKITPISGNWNPKRIVIIEFPSEAALKKCFSSEEYLEIAPLREHSTAGWSIMVEGTSNK